MTTHPLASFKTQECPEYIRYLQNQDFRKLFAENNDALKKIEKTAKPLKTLLFKQQNLNETEIETTREILTKLGINPDPFIEIIVTCNSYEEEQFDRLANSSVTSDSISDAKETVQDIKKRQLQTKIQAILEEFRAPKEKILEEMQSFGFSEDPSQFQLPKITIKDNFPEVPLWAKEAYMRSTIAAATEPAATKPAATKPAATKPAATEPVATNPLKLPSL